MIFHFRHALMNSVCIFSLFLAMAPYGHGADSFIFGGKQPNNIDHNSAVCTKSGADSIATYFSLLKQDNSRCSLRTWWVDMGLADPSPDKVIIEVSRHVVPCHLVSCHVGEYVYEEDI
jgi:hypothetical protein